MANPDGSPMPHEIILADAMVGMGFVSEGWKKLHSVSNDPSQAFGFRHCFISSGVHSVLREMHNLDGTPELAALETTSSREFKLIFEKAGLSIVHAKDVLLLLFCRTPVLEWHVAATKSHLIVRSSAMSTSFGVRWDDILRFEANTGFPKHYIIRARPESVRARGRSTSGHPSRYDSLGPFEERLLLPAVLVQLLDRLKERLTAYSRSMREAQEQNQDHCDANAPIEGQTRMEMNSHDAQDEIEFDSAPLSSDTALRNDATAHVRSSHLAKARSRKLGLKDEI